MNAHAPDAAAPSELQGPAEELLDAMLAQVPQDAADLDPRQERFEGALELLGAIGLADGREWDARRRRRLGWPTAEEERAEEQGFGLGGHQVDLLASIPGADEWRGGRRLLLVLRFADGVSFHLESESCDPDFDSFDDWPVWQLTDDLGTRYETVASGGGAGRETVDFGIGPPSDARWLELSLAGEPGTRFRVGL